MWLGKMAWKNMWRNRSRTLITMAAVFFAVILSILTSSLQEGTFGNLVRNVVSFYTGYVQVHKQGYWDEQNLDNSFESSDQVKKSILKLTNVITLTSRLESFALASSAEITKGTLVVGIDPASEDQITLLRSKLQQGDYLTDQDNAVLLAAGLAERLKLLPGDTIVLIGQGYHGSTAAGKYPVKGILKFGSPELNSKIVFMPLVAAQEFFGAYGKITSYVLSLKNTSDLEATASSARSELGPTYEVMTWEEIIPDIQQHIETDTNNMKYIQAVLYLLICFGIFGTLVMMMVERKFEMGMLVAVGMKKTKLMSLFLLESVFTVFAGCLLGIITSVPLVHYLNRHPIKMGGEAASVFGRFGFEAIFPTSTAAANFINQGLIVMAIGLLLSVYPACKIIRLNPVTAMKK